ncbi:MAG: hypothetical protein ABJG26_03085 [Marinomonas sp.]
MSWLHILAACLIVLATFFHSFAGQAKLIAPTLAVDDPFIQQAEIQAITRFGWHSASGFFLLTALTLVVSGVPELLIWATGALWSILGLANIVMLKAKHPGGYILSHIGGLILAGQVL